MNYDRVFPFWGTKAYERGIDIPYPIGFMANYFWMDQGLLIDNFQLGFENAYDGLLDFPLQQISDSIIGFGNNSNESWSFNIRPDIWIFPFIDLYGIFGYGRSTTTIEVNAFQYTPEPIRFTSVVDQGITTYGVGALFAGGLGPVWLSVDANITWNKPELLEEATFANVVGIRMGKVFKFNKKPQSNISLWIGTMYVSMQSETLGAIALRDAIPDFDNTKAQLIQDLEDKKGETGVIGDKLIDRLIEEIESRDGESLISYAMDKQVKEHWNGLIGAQYQLNKTWQLRAEGGVIGDRKSFLISLNYRLLGFKKKAKVIQ
ncbi:MAG: hypothetical protein GXO47_01540 [Chlorobi bacterium]|nr:hypothetical protein [Chlorobiota bacterium]